MLCGKYLLLCGLSCVFIFKSTTVYGLIDPITGALVAGALITGYFFDKMPNFFGCSNELEIKGKVSLNIQYFFL